MKKWSPLAEEYDPLKCGSIDGTDTQVHDKAIERAIHSQYRPNKRVTGNPHKTIFVARLNRHTSEGAIKQIFSTFGEVVKVSLVRDVVTGFSRGYAFVEFKESKSVHQAYGEANKLNIDGNCILVDYELERTMKGWKPRRLGGGFGGKKESGQLRFGCRDRPFKRPIILNKGSKNWPHEQRSKDFKHSRFRYESHKRR